MPPRSLWKSGVLKPAGAVEKRPDELTEASRAAGDLEERRQENTWFRNHRLRKVAASLARVLEIALIAKQRDILERWKNFDSGSVLTDEVGELLRSP